MAHSRPNLQGKHGPLTPSLSAGGPQMFVNTVGVYGLSIHISNHFMPNKSGDGGFSSPPPPLPLTYKLSKLLSGLAINL